MAVRGAFSHVCTWVDATSHGLSISYLSFDHGAHVHTLLDLSHWQLMRLPKLLEVICNAGDRCGTEGRLGSRLRG